MIENLQTIEHMSQRVLLTYQIAECYGTSTDTIKTNYNRNKDRYIEEKHFFVLTGQDLKEFLQVTECNLQNKNKIRSLYLWTEKGALLHAKSLNTGKAWEVYDILVDTYFRKSRNENVGEKVGNNKLWEKDRERHDTALMYLYKHLSYMSRKKVLIDVMNLASEEQMLYQKSNKIIELINK